METDEGVTGLTATIKQRFYNHQLSFKDAKYQNCMALSKYVWLLKNNVNFAIKWSIQKKSPAFNNAAKRCDLCLAEIKSLRLADKDTSLTDVQNLSPSAGTRTK